jgi:hypothetical protein
MIHENNPEQITNDSRATKFFYHHQPKLILIDWSHVATEQLQTFKQNPEVTRTLAPNK